MHNALVLTLSLLQIPQMARDSIARTVLPKEILLKVILWWSNNCSWIVYQIIASKNLTSTNPVLAGVCRACPCPTIGVQNAHETWTTACETEESSVRASCLKQCPVCLLTGTRLKKTRDPGINCYSNGGELSNYLGNNYEIMRGKCSTTRWFVSAIQTTIVKRLKIRCLFSSVSNTFPSLFQFTCKSNNAVAVV